MRAINEDDVIKMLSDGWRSGKYPTASTVRSLPTVDLEDKLKKIADALSEKMAYMNMCPNERAIILGYLGVKRSNTNHCNTDCWKEECESYHYETRKQLEPCDLSEEKWIPCTPETMPDPNVKVIMQCRGKAWPDGYRYFQTIGCWIPRFTIKIEDKWTDLPDDSCEEYNEELDDYYCLEGWYEECTNGDGDCQSWYMNADVIAWMPLPASYTGGDEGR